MKSHQLIRKTPNMKMAQIGRGGKRGKTSGRGTKGQDSRAGAKKRPELRDFIKKIPKLRGYAFKSFQSIPVVISLTDLDKAFKAGERVEPRTLEAKGLIEKLDGNFPRVKILSTGEISKKLIITDCQVSKTAIAAIEKAGGKVHI